MKRVAVFVLFFGFILSALYSQKTEIRFRHISLEDGLSQSMVSCIIQDQQGFMWFGTQDGLNRYDGYRFEVYRPKLGNPDSISSNIISALWEDNQNVIWIGTNGQGLNCFHPAIEKFVRFMNLPDQTDSLSNNFVNDIKQDHQDNLWIATRNGLNLFNPKTKTFAVFKHHPSDPASISHNTITTIYRDRANNLWIGTNNGLNLWDPQKRSFMRFQRTSSNGLMSNRITDILEDHSGELWIGTNRGLHRFDYPGGNFHPYQHNPGNPGSISSNNVSQIFEDRTGILWVLTTDSGLNTFNRRTEQFNRFKVNAEYPNSLSSNNLLSIFEDRSGLLWLGTADRGINRFDRETERFSHYRHDSRNPNSLSHNFVYALVEDPSDFLWIGTNGGGLNRLDRRSNQFKTYRFDRNNQNSLNSDNLQSLHMDSKGYLWIGTIKSGLNRFNPKDETFISYTRQRGNPNSLSSNNVKVILEDSFQNLWIGTIGGGLNKMNPTEGTFTRFLNNPDDPNSIGGNNIRSIHEDRDRILWIGTTFGGLNKYCQKKKTFTRYQSQLDNPNSLSNNNVQSIFRDSSGIIWIGTFGGGLNKFNPIDETFTHYRETEGLPNNVVYGILPDEEGHLWLSTNKGLSRFNPVNESFKNYSYKDGLQSNEFNGGAFHRGRSGELFFGGLNGFNSFFPSRIRSNPYIPPVHITDFQISNKSVPIDKNGILKKHISNTRLIRIPYKKNVFSFHFVALDFNIPEKNQYRYKMENFDYDWISTDGSRRFASYSNLSPGEYTFHVKGSNSDGTWNNEGSKIAVYVIPPFYLTFWFKFVVTLILFTLLFTFYRVRMRLISHKARLETELFTARETQMSIMPQENPNIEGYDISGICKPAHEVGGDFFDYIWINPENTRYGIIVGDVSGSSMKAAMTAVLSSGMLYAHANSKNAIKDILTLINHILYLKTDKKMFTALCMTAIDIKTNEMTFANAGLCEPLMKSGDSLRFIQSLGPRFPLGSLEDTTYMETKITLNPEDTVIYFTDGIPDAHNPAGEFYAYDNLTKFVQQLDTRALSASQIIDAIIEDVERFSGDADQHDDMTVVVVKRKK